MKQRWPDTLWIVRHGESAGNVARDAAYAAGLPTIEIAERDVDVPLSAAGEVQSRALGRWFAECPEDQRPDVVMVSPYLRARHTTSLIAEAGGVAQPGTTIVDERLREREFGILDRLTHLGIEQRYPEQAQMRTRLGKFAGGGATNVLSDRSTRKTHRPRASSPRATSSSARRSATRWPRSR